MERVKLLTFLGMGKYERVTYHWAGHPDYTTDLFPEALANWLQPAEILVLLTSEAKAHQHWSDLQDRLRQRNLVQPRPVDIPSGRSEEELWRIFTTLTQCMDDQPVVFDVTHAFRSLPIVALLATAYLRVAHTVPVKGLVYGAFEAKVDNRAPVFDLTPFLSLLDWVTATDQFLRTGNAEALARLLPSGGPTGSLAQTVTGIAQGLHLLRPMDVMQQAAKLPDHITAAVPHIAKSVAPFASLLKRVQEGYGAFGLTDPRNYQANAKASLVCQLHMVEWYHQKKQYVHALSMAREWLPSLLCWHFQVDPMQLEERNDMELLLNGGTQKDNNIVRQSPRLTAWNELPMPKRNRCSNYGRTN